MQQSHCASTFSLARTAGAAAALALAACSSATDSDTPDTLASHYALDFTDDCVQVPDTDVLDFSRSFTLEAWIKPRDVHAARSQHIVSKWGASGDAAYALEVHAGKLRTVIHDAAHTTQAVESNGALQNDVWQHVAVTRGDDTLKLYIDGMLDRISTHPSIPANSSQPLTVGQERSTDYTGRSFDGVIDEVRVWNVTRPEKLILHRMHRRLRGYEYGLVGYWPFDEGHGTIAHDVTINSLDATITGARWTTDTAPLTR
jgi:hypothetical protein